VILHPPFEKYDRQNENTARVVIRQQFDQLAVELPFRVLQGSAVWNPASTADGAVAMTTVDVLGAVVGNPVWVGFSANTAGNAVLWSAYVDQVDRVRVCFLNKTGGALDLGSGTVTVLVVQPR